MNRPRILIVDIETLPLIAAVWGTRDQQVGLNQIRKDWTIASWAAKWLGEKKVYYQDVSKQKNKRDDSKILKGIHKMMCEADLIVGQNSKRFDVKKLNARFIINKMSPPSSYRQHDTTLIARKIFGFTSNKLEYMADQLCKKKKLKHKEFPGMELWNEFEAGNPRAAKEMRLYNMADVEVTEELYLWLRTWDKAINFDVFRDDEQNICECGSPAFSKKGFAYSNTGKFQRFKCKKCGRDHQSKTNLLGSHKKKTLTA